MKRYLKEQLKPYNSFGIEAVADELVCYGNEEELRDVFANMTPGIPWSVLSGGNNILFSGDYHGVLIHPVAREIKIVSEADGRVHVNADAGVEWDDFVAWCVERGLWGVENLSLIPGYVGAAPVQNIGAYGREVKDVVGSVEMFCVESGKMLTLAGDHCAFGYRDSVFKHTLKGKVVITGVNFILERNGEPCLGYGDLSDKVGSLGGPTLVNIRKAVIDIREVKLPDTKKIGNAGSFFKNPVVSKGFADNLKVKYPSMPVYPAGDGVKLAAGWLIDQCGWKGHKRERVGVHDRQALVLVNLGGASGADVLGLAEDIREDVRSRFGVELEMEVNVL